MAANSKMQSAPAASSSLCVGSIQKIVNEGYEWCAAIDLKSFFDKIPQGIILKLIRRKMLGAAQARAASDADRKIAEGRSHSSTN